MDYVMSDIHGKYEKFINMLDLIKFNNEDNLYILGDIIDRGENPLKLIKHIMSSKNIKMCLGNHESLMIDAYNEGEITEENINYAVSYLNAIDNYCDINQFNISKIISLVHWIRNGGEVTARQFIKLSEEEQEEIVCFFEDLPLYFEYKDYILSHAGMNLRGMTNINWEEIKKKQEINDFIWSRKEFYEHKGPNDKFVIFGHTPAINGKLDIWFDHYYKDKLCIDCGAAYGGKLCCVELKKLNVYYI